MTQTVFCNARLILPDEVLHGSLVIEDGVITAIDGGPSQVAGAINLENDYLIPGLIELHTDNLERHITPRPKVDWPHNSAILAHDAELASVGITTVFNAMRVGSVVSNAQLEYRKYARKLAREVLEMRKADALRISHFLHLRAEICSETLLEELDEFGRDDRVGILSLMDHTPGQRQFRDLSKLKDYVCGKFGMNDLEFERHVSEKHEIKERLGATHEAAAVAAAGRLGAVLASHDDTTEEHVRLSAQYGVRLSEFPTTEEAAEANKDHGIATIMGAPNLVRGGSHSGNVAASQLADRDLLDIVSSDYIPASLLSAAVMLGDLWDNLPKGIATVTDTPAQMTDLIDRGALSIGKRADFVRVRRLNGTPVLQETWSNGRRVC